MSAFRWVAFAAVVSALLGLTQPAAAAPGPSGHGEWWFDTWEVPALWAQGARGQGVVIGEIDTGVNARLPELAGRVLPGKDFGSAGGDGRVDRDIDPFGHGTAMASLMVGRSGAFDVQGLAPGARVLPVAVPITGTTDDAGGDANNTLLQAVRWATDHGAKIISMSLGAPRDSAASGRSCPTIEQNAIDYALAKGVIVVASAGNSGESGNPVEEPSVCLGVVSVGAVDRSGAVPPWSSRHPYLTVVAPGANVPTVGRLPGEAFFGEGTSQAAAITSAGLAVIWSRYPELTGNQVVARLLATLDGHRSTRDPARGYGAVDIGAAVRAHVPTNAPDPVFAGVEPFLAKDRQHALPTPAAPAVGGQRRPLPGPAVASPPTSPLASGPGLAGLVVALVGLSVGVGAVVGWRLRSGARGPGVVDAAVSDGVDSAG